MIKSNYDFLGHYIFYLCNRGRRSFLVDTKIATLLTVVRLGSYTKAAEELNLTQPAVSHHIRQLEEEFGIKVFQKGRKALVLTAEGEILVKYASRAMAIYHTARQALEDYRTQATHLNIGTTHTVGENLVSQVLALYCNEHPDTHINIVTDSINNIYNKLGLYELDLAIVEGVLPSGKFQSVLLDTDYLCLIVSPQHKFARRPTILLSELKKEKLILRPATAGTRMLFENLLMTQGESIRNFNVMMELDNVSMIKNLVSMNLGVSVIAHSAIREEEREGRLVVVPIENAKMTRDINMVYQPDFTHHQVLEELRRIYNSVY